MRAWHAGGLFLFRPAGPVTDSAGMHWDEVVALIRQNEVGRDTSIETPYGRRLLCYADLTATGRFLHFVEAWVRCLRPYYANTHTVDLLDRADHDRAARAGAPGDRRAR